MLLQQLKSFLTLTKATCWLSKVAKSRNDNDPGHAEIQAGASFILRHIPSSLGSGISLGLSLNTTLIDMLFANSAHPDFLIALQALPLEC